MSTFMVTLYDFSDDRLLAGGPLVVQANSAAEAANLFVGQPLSATGSLASMAADVKRFDGTQLAEQTILYFPA